MKKFVEESDITDEDKQIWNDAIDDYFEENEENAANAVLVES